MKWKLTTSGLVLANAALFSLCLWRLSAGPADITAASSSAVAAEPVESPAIVVPAPNIDAVQSAAIFHASRQYHEPNAPVAVEQPPPDYRFAGAMLMPGKSAAHLINNQTQARMKVAPGDMLEGWNVIAVGPRAITIQQGQRTVEIGASTQSASFGMRPMGSQESSRPAGAGSVRVLSDGASGPHTAPASVSGAAVGDAPRLYRPPPN